MRRAKDTIRHFWQEKLLKPARQLTRVEVLVAIIAGVMGGIFPVPLVTTIASLLLARSLEFAFPQFAVATTANMFCTPLQLFCIPIFAQTAATIFRESTAPYTPKALTVALQLGLMTLLKTCAKMLLYATFTWFLLIIPVWTFCRLAQQRVRRRRESALIPLPGREHIVRTHIVLP